MAFQTERRLFTPSDEEVFVGFSYIRLTAAAATPLSGFRLVFPPERALTAGINNAAVSCPSQQGGGGAGRCSRTALTVCDDFLEINLHEKKKLIPPSKTHPKLSDAVPLIRTLRHFCLNGI
jgi:hypothetical protein